ncbi:hypothetical protein Q5P01_022053 [Channa striata]|uniref:Uncharacterized protein n=1 Tax=Channa striata TaxID=64152 RepID=A0AA88IX55_CHASR|nr:hypothetical protein Q5P01_022053 [Channa striata]
MDPGFSDSEMAAMNLDAADLLDRLDLSTSSIDMTSTSLAMHEEEESDISGVEELEDSVVSSTGNQTEPQELSSWAGMDLTSALTSADILSNADIQPAEPSHLVTESTQLQSFRIKSSDSSSPPMATLSVEALHSLTNPAVSPEDQPYPSPPNFFPSSAKESVADDSFAHNVIDATGLMEESVEDLDVSHAHHCHENKEEEPEELHLK